MISRLREVRSALFLPASKAGAIAKARTLGADLVILDLEDSVREEGKALARGAAVEAARIGFGPALVAIRVNGSDHEHYEADCAAVRGSAAGLAILPKASSPDQIGSFANDVAKPVLAMVETPGAVLQCAQLAAAPGVAGLIAGTNDLAAELGVGQGGGRAALVTSLQLIVLAARAARIAAFDGVFNAIDDVAGFEAEAEQGRAFGFDGKALIHPSQVEPANCIFAPSAAEIEESLAIVAVAGGGAERFRGRMIEAMHVSEARRSLARAHRGRRC